MKENLAAALLFLSGRSRKNNFIDPCCGSGTLCIEAAMIAKNIAPGLHRSFAFQEFSNYDSQLFSDYHTSAKESVYQSSDYRII
jgi:putative N6-adenine-specific DNA methylase